MFNKNELIHMYEDILDGKRTRFPNGTWQCEENIKIVVQHLFSNILKWNTNKIKKKLSWNTLVEYKLSGLLSDKKFCGSPYKIINFVYPNKILPWELHRSPINTWDEDNIKKAVNWLLKEKLKWSDNDIRVRLRAETLRKYNLSGILDYFQGSPYKMLNFVYPEVFKPWELKNVSWRILDNETSCVDLLAFISMQEKKSIKDISIGSIKKYCQLFVNKDTKLFKKLIAKMQLIIEP